MAPVSTYVTAIRQAPLGTVAWVPGEAKVIPITLVPKEKPAERIKYVLEKAKEVVVDGEVVSAVPLIVNIETTGIMPFEARLISISYKDPNMPESEPTVILAEDELSMLQQFLGVFKQQLINQIIGYNVSFDYRFILARCMYYRLACKEFADVELYDMMQVMKQIKQAYVFGYNKTGSLSEWSELYFNLPKPYTDAKMQEYYKLKDYDKVREFASSQVTRVFLLYTLSRAIIETGYTGFPLV